MNAKRIAGYALYAIVVIVGVQLAMKACTRDLSEFTSPSKPAQERTHPKPWSQPPQPNPLP